MGGMLLEIEGDLLARDQDEVVGVLVGVQEGGLGDHVVVGDEQELVAVVLVPARHPPRRFVAVGVVGMGVGVALDPAGGLGGHRPGNQEQGQDRDQCLFHLRLHE